MNEHLFKPKRENLDTNKKKDKGMLQFLCSCLAWEGYFLGLPEQI